MPKSVFGEETGLAKQNKICFTAAILQRAILIITKSRHGEFRAFLVIIIVDSVGYFFSPERSYYGKENDI